MNELELQHWIKTRSKSFIDINTPIAVPRSVPQRDDASALELVQQGEEENVGRVSVSIKSRRVRPVDPDNLCAGCKALLDSLRQGKLIRNDDPCSIQLNVSQEKVRSYKEEETIISITPI